MTVVQKQEMFTSGQDCGWMPRRFVLARLALLWLLCLLVSGCAGLRRRSAPATEDILRYQGYHPQAAGIETGVQGKDEPLPDMVRDRPLRSRDPVRIILRGPEQIEIEEVLDENGMVNLPNIGRVHLGGLTTSEAEDEIQSAYIDGGIYLRLTVNVISMARVRRDSFYVYGEARGPGRYDFTEGITLMQAIATAGGLTDDARASRVYIRREGRSTRYNLRPMLRGDGADVHLQPGDVITIKSRWF